jgi:CRP/FNR family transcriptional regulator, cyclic AMP receptor protein
MTDYALPCLLDLLPPGECELLRARGRRSAYRDGETIHERGDAYAGMGIVISGAVKLVRQLDDGRQVVLATVNPGQHYGDNNALQNRRRSHHAVSIGPSLVDHYPPDEFLRLLDNPQIVRALYTVAVHRLSQALEVVDDVRSLTPEARLIKLLGVMRTSAGGDSRLPCLQDDLAGLLGVSSMTVAKSLKALKRQGLIETGYRAIAICDVPRFNALLAEIQES